MSLPHGAVAFFFAVTAMPATVAAADSPPPAHARAAARDPSPDAETRPAASEPDRSLVRVGAAIEAGSRHFAYVDRLTSGLRPYDLFAAPLAVLRVDASPFARSETPSLSGLGLTGEYAHAFGLASADANGTSVSTTWQALHVDLRERLAFGRSVTAGVHGGFGAIDFSFGDALGSGVELPNVGYRFVRVGLDGQLTAHDFGLYAQASYLDVLSTGMMGTLFPRESVGGVDARAGVSWPLPRGFDASLELAYTRFFYTLRPEPGDANVAGGALDEMVGVSVGLAYRM